MNDYWVHKNITGLKKQTWILKQATIIIGVIVCKSDSLALI